MKRTRKSLRPTKDANKRIPVTVTSQVIEKIASLRSSVKTDYLKSCYLSKFVSKDTEPASVRRQRAINKWLATEANNAATNDRLLITHEEYNILPRVSFSRFVDFTRNVIAKTIGDIPPWECLIGTFSGGASTSRPRTSSHPALKYVGKADITSRAYELFSLLRSEFPGWPVDDDDINVVPGNILFTVPKKTDIDRCACKEPDLNMFMQKGVGDEFRRCLKRVGINLNDQSINRRLAHVGSVTDGLATLDLSAASDSVSSGLVQLLLPEHWFYVLDSLRSPVTLIDGDVHQNEMFSSMGNGFTFELESLLFYSIARAVAYFKGISGVISVYGDDIICPSDMAHDLVWVLGYFGFESNLDKSFISGPFRESCGGHYYNGLDVTPFYIRKPLETVMDIIHVANSLRKWADMSLSVLDPEAEEIWLWLRSMVPEYLWGGNDCNDPHSLVTRDNPRKRLKPLKKILSTAEGGYFHWLNITWDREILRGCISTSERSIEKACHRLSRHHDIVNTVFPAFLFEIDGYAADTFTDG